MTNRQKKLIENYIRKIVTKTLNEQSPFRKETSFRKGDKVKTRKGDIETVLRINSNGNVETEENDYSWPPDSLTLVENYIRKMVISEILKETANNIEYVIWGVPPGKTDEDLLVSKLEGKTVTDLKIAERVKDVLETKHGCKNVRIQTVNMSDNDFSAFKKPF